MAARRKRIKNDTPWPAHWEIQFEWGGMKTRESEFQVSGSREWHLFDRFVTNTETGSKWVDGFRQKPYDSFVAFDETRLTKTRTRRRVPVRA